MHRDVLIACLPCLVALVLSCASLCVVARLSRARVELRRLRELHRCQQGGVQSLAFVLTMPVFLCIVQFIVQVSQLMIGVMAVNYSAWAAARSAAVWIPARASFLGENKTENLNVINYGTPGLTRDTPIVLTNDEPRIEQSHPKYRQIYKAAVMALMPAAPSRDLGLTTEPMNTTTIESLQGMYQAVAPKSQQNARVNKRLENKFNWAWRNTAVRVSFVDKNSKTGWTHNPDWTFYTTLPNGQTVPYNPYDPHEVGWEDPITVQVTHDFALLPGPGRVLAKHLVNSSGQPDRVAQSIRQTQTQSPTREKVHTVPIWASATMTAEGLKSLVPYAEATN